MSQFGSKICYQAKQMAFNVYEYFKKKKLDPTTVEYQKDINLKKYVAEATGLSETTVGSIIKEGKILKSKNQKFKKEVIGRPRKKRIPIRDRLDDYTKAVVRKKITDHYNVHKKILSLKMLQQILKEENIFHSGISYLRKLVQELDIKECQANDGKQEIPSKWAYLNSVVMYRNDNRSIIYLDEIYVNNHKQTEEATSAAFDIEKEPRMIVFDCGAQTGFVEKAVMILKSKTGEYGNYRTWITKTLLPNIPPMSVIIKHTADEINQIENLLKENGHDVVFLPPEHPELNPIESVWGDLKGQLPQMALDCNFDQNALQGLFVEKWQLYVNPIIKTEHEHYQDEEESMDDDDDSPGHHNYTVIVKEEIDEEFQN